MSVKVKYAIANNSVHAQKPKHATIDSAGYDLFAAKSKTLLPHVVTQISLDLHFEIPDGYFGKIYPISGLLVEHFVSWDAGVIDSGYRGVVLAWWQTIARKNFLFKKVIELPS